jgi:hypothetical protein
MHRQNFTASLSDLSSRQSSAFYFGERLNWLYRDVSHKQHQGALDMILLSKKARAELSGLLIYFAEVDTTNTSLQRLILSSDQAQSPISYCVILPGFQM